MPEVNGAIIEPLAEKIKELNDAYPGSPSHLYLYSGMATLARDMYYYLSSHSRGDAKLFDDIIHSVIEEEKKEQGYLEGWWENKLPFPYDDNEIGVLRLPKGIVEAAAGGKIDISALYTDTIIHEWTSLTGRILFQRFKSKFKEVICDKGGLYEQFNKEKISEKGLPMLITIDVVKHGFSNETFWIPIILYFAVILVKKGLKEYCKA